MDFCIEKHSKRGPESLEKYLRELQRILDEDGTEAASFFKYLEGNPDLDGYLKSWDEFNNRSSVFSCFLNLFGSLLTRLNTPLFRNLAYGLSRKLCKHHMKLLYRSLNPSSCSVSDVGACLKILGSIQWLSLISCKELYTVFDFNVRHLTALLKPRKKSSRQDPIRVGMIDFILGFVCSEKRDPASLTSILNSGESNNGSQDLAALKSELIVKASKLIYGIFAGLENDTDQTIFHVLGTLKTYILDDDKVSRVSKAILFSARSMVSILNVLRKRKLQESSDIDSIIREVIMTIFRKRIHKIEGADGGKGHKVVFEFLGNLRVVQDEKQQSTSNDRVVEFEEKLLISILEECPELIGKCWSLIPGLSVDPKSSTFLSSLNIINSILLLPVYHIQAMKPGTHDQRQFSHLFPTGILNKTTLGKLLLGSKDDSVKLLLSLILVQNVFQRIEKSFKFYRASDTISCESSVLADLRKLLPDFQIFGSIFSHVQSTCISRDPDSYFLILPCVLRIVSFYQSYLPDILNINRFQVSCIMPEDIVDAPDNVVTNVLNVLAEADEISWFAMGSKGKPSPFQQIVRTLISSPKDKLATKSVTVIRNIMQSLMQECGVHEYELETGIFCDALLSLRSSSHKDKFEVFLGWLNFFLQSFPREYTKFSSRNKESFPLCPIFPMAFEQCLKFCSSSKSCPEAVSLITKLCSQMINRWALYQNQSERLSLLQVLNGIQGNYEHPFLDGVKAFLRNCKSEWDMNTLGPFEENLNKLPYCCIPWMDRSLCEKTGNLPLDIYIHFSVFPSSVLNSGLSAGLFSLFLENFTATIEWRNLCLTLLDHNRRGEIYRLMADFLVSNANTHISLMEAVFSKVIIQGQSLLVSSNDKGNGKTLIDCLQTIVSRNSTLSQVYLDCFGYTFQSDDWSFYLKNVSVTCCHESLRKITQKLLEFISNPLETPVIVPKPFLQCLIRETFIPESVDIVETILANPYKLKAQLENHELMRMLRRAVSKNLESENGEILDRLVLLDSIRSGLFREKDEKLAKKIFKCLAKGRRWLAACQVISLYATSRNKEYVCEKLLMKIDQKLTVKDTFNFSSLYSQEEACQIVAKNCMSAYLLLDHASIILERQLLSKSQTNDFFDLIYFLRNGVSGGGSLLSQLSQVSQPVLKSVIDWAKAELAEVEGRSFDRDPKFWHELVNALLEHSNLFLVNPFLQDYCISVMQFLSRKAGNEQSPYFSSSLYRIFSTRSYLATQKHVTLMVSLYTATTRPFDKALLETLKVMETGADGNLLGLRLLFWGSKSGMVPNKVDSNAITEFIADRFDPNLMQTSIFQFACNVAVGFVGKDRDHFLLADDEPVTTYDPEFILAWLQHVVLGFDKKLLKDIYVLFESGLVPFVICCLSVSDTELRVQALQLLQEIHCQVKESRMKEKNQMTLLFDSLRYGIEDPLERVPFLHAIFFAHCCMIFSKPYHFMYPWLNLHLIQNSGKIDFENDFPLFLQLLYSSSDSGERCRSERLWILRLTSNAVSVAIDHERGYFRKWRVWEHVMNLFGCATSDSLTRKLCLEILWNALDAIEKLAENNGRSLLNWFEQEYPFYLWFTNAWNSIIASTNSNGTKGNRETEMLIFLMRLYFKFEKATKGKTKTFVSAIPIHRFMVKFCLEQGQNQEQNQEQVAASASILIEYLHNMMSNSDDLEILEAILDASSLRSMVQRLSSSISSNYKNDNDNPHLILDGSRPVDRELFAAATKIKQIPPNQLLKCLIHKLRDNPRFTSRDISFFYSFIASHSQSGLLEGASRKRLYQDTNSPVKRIKLQVP